MENHRVVLIRPFFQGHFLNYFQLFLNSCACNPNFDWLIFTDNDDEYDFPPNVHKIMMTFEEAKDLFQSKFDFPINIPNPGKLHDFKPAYGYIFSDYLRGYDFWGQTDYDVIYGKLDDFVTDELLDSYDKIFTKGHFALYRNSSEMNLLFKTELNGRALYKEVMQAGDNRNFDEDWNGRPNANDIYRANGMRVYENVNNERKVADIYAKSTKFRVVYQNRIDSQNIVEPVTNSLFVHVDGRLTRYIMANGRLKTEDFMYIHLKQRNMKLIDRVEQCMDFAIIPDAFYPFRGEVTEEDFGSYKKRTMNINYIKLRWNNLKIKVKNKRRI